MKRTIYTRIDDSGLEVEQALEYEKEVTASIQEALPEANVLNFLGENNGGILEIGVLPDPDYEIRKEALECAAAVAELGEYAGRVIARAVLFEKYLRGEHN
jgi:hypothetical protein